MSCLVLALVEISLDWATYQDEHNARIAHHRGGVYLARSRVRHGVARSMPTYLDVGEPS